MKNVIIVALSCAIFAFNHLQAAEPAPADSSPARANNAFALDLYRQLQGQPGNLFFSPYSLATALTMTHAGARDHTAAQMARVLHLETLADPPAAWRRFTQGLDESARTSGIQWHVANALWPQAGYPFREEFLRTIKNQFQAGVFPCDYARDPEAARQRINTWVEEQTQRKITELISPGVLTPLTRMVLVNAIYLKGRWEYAFPARDTADAPFHLPGGRTRLVPMMTQKQTLGYAENPDWQALSLPYQGGRWAMVFLLPRRVDGLAALEEQMTAEKLAQWLQGLRPRQVTLFLPRFKLTSQFQLNQKLAALGMTDAFDMNQADFSGMDGRKANLYLTAVVHKAAVEINEEGAEAAAASGVVVGVRSAPPQQPLVFRADHPFLFLIRDQTTGAIIFLGRLTQPEI
ncbi:MAG: serpin family protein [Verrucomicrobiae bacterium]|nr:serpin family protein [Verrucomicrobiae bacterium]